MAPYAPSGVRRMEGDHGMSDTSQGTGWWLASDGKWYPPELWTGPPEARPGGDISASASELGGVSGPVAASGVPAGPDTPDAPGASPMPGASTAPDPNPGAYPASRYPATGYPANGYPTTGYPGGGYPTYGYGQPSPYPAGRKTNGLAIAALVCGIAGFILFIPAVLGVIFGFIARSQIRQSGGAQGGEGMAVAGIILGFAWIVLLIVVFAISGAHNTNNSGTVLLHLAAGGTGS